MHICIRDDAKQNSTRRNSSRSYSYQKKKNPAPPEEISAHYTKRYANKGQEESMHVAVKTPLALKPSNSGGKHTQYLL
jgi:hypothetical protein